MIQKLLSLAVSCLLVFESLPLQALTNIASSDQALSSSYSLFDGKSALPPVSGSPLPLSSFSSSPFPSPMPSPLGRGKKGEGSSQASHSLSISGPFGEGTGTDPMMNPGPMPKTRPYQRPPAQETPKNEGESASSDKATPQGQAAGFISVYSTLGLGAAAALGETWALGYLQVLALASLGVWAAVIAIPLAWSLASGSVSGVVDFFSFGKNPLYPKIKSQKSDVKALSLSSYWAVKTLLFLGTLPISLPVYLSLKKGKKSPPKPDLRDDDEITRSIQTLKNQKKGLDNELEDMRTQYFMASGEPRPLWDQNVSIEPPDVDTSYYERLFAHLDKEEMKPKTSDQIRQELLQEERSLQSDASGAQESIKRFTDKLKKIEAKLKHRLGRLKDLEPTRFSWPTPNMSDSETAQDTAESSGNNNPKPLFTIYAKKENTPSVASRSFEPNNQEPKEDHLGLDIAAPQGSPVTTERSGLVLYARYHKSTTDKSLGNAVALQTSETRVVLYQHLGKKQNLKVEPNGRIRGNDQEGSGLLVKEGERIPRGVPVGTVGNTGKVMSTAKPPGDGTHLHVGVIEIDPEFNPKMRELRRKGDGKFETIRKDFQNLIDEPDPKKRAALFQDFMFNRNYRDHIYINPFRAVWNPISPAPEGNK